MLFLFAVIIIGLCVKSEAWAPFPPLLSCLVYPPREGLLKFCNVFKHFVRFFTSGNPYWIMHRTYSRYWTVHCCREQVSGLPLMYDSIVKIACIISYEAHSLAQSCDGQSHRRSQVRCYKVLNLIFIYLFFYFALNKAIGTFSHIFLFQI